MTKRKTFVIFIFSLLFALSALLFAAMGEKKAYAFFEEPASVLSLDKGDGTFDQAELSDLYGLLKTGAAQLSDLDDFARNDGEFATGTGASGFATQNIVVELGQKKWTPVHLTKDKEGHTVLTLWLAWTEDTQPWAVASTDGYPWNETPQTQFDPYPMNMYSSSYLRAYLNGTDYLAAQGEGALANGKEVQSGDWAVFLSTFGNYLDTPEEIAYQASERAMQILPKYCTNRGNTAYEYDLLNEGYAETGLNYNTADGFDYREKAGYTDWKQDKLWLPSLSETGWGSWTDYETDAHGVIYFTDGEKKDAGIWNTTWEQCFIGRSQAVDLWLRSGDTQNDIARPCGDLVYTLSNTASYGAINAARKHYVRPAIHLDLTAAEGEEPDPNESVGRPSAEPSQFEYDGTEHSLFIENYTKMNFSQVPEGAAFANGRLTAKDAGTYTLTATPKGGTWKGEEGGDPVAITLKITPKHVDVSVSNGFHVFGNAPMPLDAFFLRYGSGNGYDVFIQDEGINDLQGFSPAFTRNGNSYPLNSQLPVGYYKIVAQNGVYGNYDVTFNFTDESRYVVCPDDGLAISVGEELVIDGTVTIPYTGENVHVKYDNKPSDWRSSSVSYVGSDGVSQKGLPIEAGEYTVTVTTNVGSYSFKLIIVDSGDPVKPEETRLNKREKYSGKTVILSIPQYGKLNIGTPTEGSSYADGIFSAKDAGTYSLTVTPKTAWTDGTQSPVTYQIVIEQRTLTLTVAQAGHVYGRTPATLHFIAGGDGFAAGEDLESLGLSFVFTLTKDGQTYPLSSDLPVGEYAVSAKLAEGVSARNYIVKCEGGLYVVERVTLDMGATKFVIDGEEISYSALGKTYKAQYDGSEKAVLIEGLPAGVTATVVYMRDGVTLSGAPTEAGEYTVEISFTLQDAENYEALPKLSFTLTVEEKSEVDPSDPSDPSVDPEEEGDGKGKFPVWGYVVIAFGSAAVVAGLLGVVVHAVKKKRK